MVELTSHLRHVKLGELRSVERWMIVSGGTEEHNGAHVRARGFEEAEIGHRIERFGNVAQVRSVYETRRTAKGPLTGRGVNYLLLYRDGKRWCLTGQKRVP